MYIINLILGGIFVLSAMFCLYLEIFRFSKFHKDREDLLVFATILFLVASTSFIGLTLFSQGIKNWPKHYHLDQSKLDTDYDELFKNNNPNSGKSYK